MEKIILKPIGKMVAKQGRWIIKIDPEYKEAMTGIEGFSHLQVLFWFHQNDTEQNRKHLKTEKPYTSGPQELGVFATRSEYRPNLIGLSALAVKSINPDKGEIEFYFADLEDSTPVLDIKPYHPAVDRIRDVSLPHWCSHWPQNYEDSAHFNWEREFNF
ncbi:MAG: tRNA (N6-threonylcarbamoyladenosine(37)-N6)-methyltransferase TrmO [Spirochaetales bacterium]|nr:tRNA (N6-threonylcarbamoyladenosine(37)-N6)-methyltransferase TrmO [Spirochaetales bacterium]